MISNRLRNAFLGRACRCWLFAGLLSCLSLTAPAQQSAPAAGALPAADSKGSLVIIGGGLRSENSEVWQRIVKLAGGKSAKIAVIAVASYDPEESAHHLMSKLNKYGARSFLIPVGINRSPAHKAPAIHDADDPEIARQILTASGIYFTGGDQARITQALVHPNGSRSAVLEAIWQVYQRGGVIAGTSAGAAVMSSTMFFQAKPVAHMLKTGIRQGKEVAPGLGFIGEQIFIDQHVLIRGRFARMILAMEKMHYQIGLGVDENTALVVSPDREVEIIGYSGAVMIDLRKASRDPLLKEFNIRDVAISYLDRGDKFNLNTFELTPAPGKVDTETQNDPKTMEKIFVNDILANSVVRELMERLVDNIHDSATGLAFELEAGHKTELGFEFVFRKIPESIAYGAFDANVYSIFNLRLDINPVRLQQPIYTPIRPLAASSQE